VVKAVHFFLLIIIPIEPRMSCFLFVAYGSFSSFFCKGPDGVGGIFD
jgi:hypothetical protein